MLRAPLDARTASHVTQGRDIAERRRAKHPAVLAAELGGALIANLKRRGRGIQAVLRNNSILIALDANSRSKDNSQGSPPCYRGTPEQ